MTHPEHDRDRPYWQETEDLGLLFYGRAHRPLHARWHTETERPRGSGHPRLFGVGMGDFQSDYLHTQFLVPANGLHRDITLATGQAWHYPADRTVVLWELIPERELTVRDPRESLVYRTLWAHYERALNARFPSADTLLTTWEDEFARPAWQGFVSALGYHQTQPAVFHKTLLPHAVT